MYRSDSEAKAKVKECIGSLSFWCKHLMNLFFHSHSLAAKCGNGLKQMKIHHAII
jgi:hypothetical protein